jgi:VIT1/CCC1 family predicted Fe2+/Mn2+ transporter
MFVKEAVRGLYVSSLVTLVTLFCFGYLKSIYLRPKQALIGALQTLAIGAVAAAFSFGAVAFFDDASPVVSET